MPANLAILEEVMAEPLALKAARPRKMAARPGYPALAAVALSLCLPACFGATTGSIPNPYEDADVSRDAAEASHPKDAGLSLDAESEANATRDVPSDHDP